MLLSIHENQQYYIHTSSYCYLPLELLFHEITGITNLLNSLTNQGIMKHLEATNVHHELGGRKSIIFYTNVARFLIFFSHDITHLLSHP